ncbi:M48 family metallopeptidase [Jeongeupia naejangsanensis]|uniref:M48 family metallopeptidase n=1 Tax=Jeongeupia naejangsanensis TaxID=613195 RepID=A0ABS2BLF8_9NEIS|nr:M48 family metallopeptidase [Jeongeupia naejangsanensis]MBM3116445.1 M48 family metallopeptidase [Jeongeupia naejangsanensis]
MKRQLTAIAIAATVLLGGCQQVSTTGTGATNITRKQSMSMLVSEKDVVQMSAQAYNDTLGKAKSSGKLNADAALTRRVRSIADRIIPQTAVFRPDALNWQWEVNVEQSKELNAYCMAGGKIMFYSGIITQLKLSDDEIAQIMGHEIAHALREHARERMSSEANKQIAMQGLSILTGGKYDALLGMGDQLIAVGYSLPNSREHESEADVMGLELAARAGYKPQAAVTLWQKMAAASQGGSPEFLSTHPSSSTRIRDLQAQIPKVEPLYETAVTQYGSKR